MKHRIINSYTRNLSQYRLKFPSQVKNNRFTEIRLIGEILINRIIIFVSKFYNTSNFLLGSFPGSYNELYIIYKLFTIPKKK